MTTGPAPSQDPPRWDLSNIYPGLGTPEFQRAVDDLVLRLDALDAYLDDQGMRRDARALPPDRAAAAIAGYVERMNAAKRRHDTLVAYTFAFTSTDSADSLARHRESELEILGARLEQAGVRFQGWLGGQADGLRAAIEANDTVRAHAFHLTELAEQSRYLMSESEESLAAELALSGRNAWSRLQNSVVSQVTVAFERDGRSEMLAATEVINLARDPDPDVRRRAHEAEVLAWAAVREPLAAALNGVTGTAVTLARRRGRTDVLHAAMDQGRVDRATLDAMFGAMEASFPAFRRYFRRKAERLGHEALPWWDLFAPTAGTTRRYSFLEARDFLLEQFLSFSPRLGALTQRAFDEHWIDAEPRPGKGAGAFCMALPEPDESRIFCNFDGSLAEVMTIAHELGHAFHTECQVGRPPLRRITPMTLAETASIFNETMAGEAALAATDDADERLAILEASLMNSAQAIVDIASRFYFEQEVHERRAHAELAADEFCEIMLRAQERTYGSGLDGRYRHPYMWAWKAHYYRPDTSFYNFPYAFGLLFGLGLYTVYLERGAAFMPEYEAMLARTGEATALELAAGFGIDLHRPDFWRSSLALIEDQIERYVAL